MHGFFTINFVRLNIGAIKMFLDVLETNDVVINIPADLETAVTVVAPCFKSSNTVFAKATITVDAKHILFVFPHASMIDARPKELAFEQIHDPFAVVEFALGLESLYHLQI